MSGKEKYGCLACCFPRPKVPDEPVPSETPNSTEKRATEMSEATDSVSPLPYEASIKADPNVQAPMPFSPPERSVEVDTKATKPPTEPPEVRQSENHEKPAIEQPVPPVPELTVSQEQIDLQVRAHIDTKEPTSAADAPALETVSANTELEIAGNCEIGGTVRAVGRLPEGSTRARFKWHRQFYSLVGKVSERIKAVNSAKYQVQVHDAGCKLRVTMYVCLPGGKFGPGICAYSAQVPYDSSDPSRPTHSMPVPTQNALMGSAERRGSLKHRAPRLADISNFTSDDKRSFMERFTQDSYESGIADKAYSEFSLEVRWKLGVLGKHLYRSSSRAGGGSGADEVGMVGSIMEAVSDYFVDEDTQMKQAHAMTGGGGGLHEADDDAQGDPAAMWLYTELDICAPESDEGDRPTDPARKNWGTDRWVAEEMWSRQQQQLRRERQKQTNLEKERARLAAASPRGPAPGDAAASEAPPAPAGPEDDTHGKGKKFAQLWDSDDDEAVMEGGGHTHVEETVAQYYGAGGGNSVGGPASTHMESTVGSHWFSSLMSRSEYDGGKSEKSLAAQSMKSVADTAVSTDTWWQNLWRGNEGAEGGGRQAAVRRRRTRARRARTRCSRRRAPASWRRRTRPTACAAPPRPSPGTPSPPRRPTAARSPRRTRAAAGAAAGPAARRKPRRPGRTTAGLRRSGGPCPATSRASRLCGGRSRAVRPRRTTHRPWRRSGRTASSRRPPRASTATPLPTRRRSWHPWRAGMGTPRRRRGACRLVRRRAPPPRR